MNVYKNVKPKGNKRNRKTRKTRIRRTRKRKNSKKIRRRTRDEKIARERTATWIVWSNIMNTYMRFDKNNIFWTTFISDSVIKFCVRSKQALNKTFFLHTSIIMPNPPTNQIEKNIAKDETMKDIRYLYSPKKKKDNDTKDEPIKDIRYIFIDQKGKKTLALRTRHYETNDFYMKHKRRLLWTSKD